MSSLVAVAPMLVSLGAASASGATAVTVSAGALGLNVAPWDAEYAAASTSGTLTTDLERGGVTQFRYGGGDTADQYDWQTNTDISSCSSRTLNLFTSGCATDEPFDFSQLSSTARQIGAQTFVTVNYGTGTPAEAAAWVRQAKNTAAQAVALWEIGNETYGCWEENNELAVFPASYQGYVTKNNSTCPMDSIDEVAGTQLLAETYAANARLFMVAMKAANPQADIGVPWAFDNSVPGASVADNNIWNDTVLSADAKDIGFVDAHWYPFSFTGTTGGANPTDQQVLNSLSTIPAQYAKIQTALAQYDPSARVVVGETGVSFRVTTIPCTPVGALFSAGDALQWLAAGARSVDWWDTDSDGNARPTCVNPEEGMFVGTSTIAPDSYYTGYELASNLLQAGAQLSTLTTSDPTDVLAYQSVLPDDNDKTAIAFINLNTADQEQITFTSPLAGDLTEQSYSAADQNASDTKVVSRSTTAALVGNAITLPAESVTVFTEN